MKNRIFLAVLALTGIVNACAQQIQPQDFSDADRERVLDFWRADNRYVVSDAPGVEVRLTVAGSEWLYKYGHSRGGGKLNPTVDAKPAKAPPSWEEWINAKVAYDRMQAQAGFQQSDDAQPGSNPVKDPGPCPPDLVALVGKPPVFAEACTPKLYTIRFDDQTISYLDHVNVRPRYAYYRFADGVEDNGSPMRQLKPDRIDHLFRLAGVDPKVANVMRAVSALEGGFDAVNTYDTGFVSVGFIQFASLKGGAGSLGAMLLRYKRSDPADFDRDLRRYGIDVTADGHLAVLDPTSGEELQGVDANAKIIADKRLIAVFGRAGAKSDAFMAAQIASAKDQFYPEDDPVKISLGGQQVVTRVGDIVTSEAGLATLMDRKVNTGRLDPFASVVQRVVDAHGVNSLVDLGQYEGEIIEQLKYRRDYLADNSLSKPTGEISTPSRHGVRRR